MPAPKGNKNAARNIGGKTRSERELASDVRTLTLREIRDTLTGKHLLYGNDTDFRKQVILKLATGILPRLTEVSGELTHSFRLTDLFNATVDEK
jgi:hypothetical protein